MQPDAPDPTCLGCDYNLRGLTEHRCPECGRAFDPEDETTFGPKQREIICWEAVLAVSGLLAMAFMIPLLNHKPSWGGRLLNVFLFITVFAFSFGFGLSAARHGKSSISRVVGASVVALYGVIIAIMVLQYLW